MPSLGQTLLAKKHINLIQLNLALDFKVFYGGRLGSNLLELGVIDENTLAESLAESLSLPAAKREDLEDIGDDILERLPADVAHRCQAVPFAFLGGVLQVAVVDPRNQQVVRELHEFTHGKIRLHVAPELRLFLALQDYYQIRMEPRMQSLALKALNPSRRLPEAASLASRKSLANPDPDLSDFEALEPWLSDSGEPVSFGLPKEQPEPRSLPPSAAQVPAENIRRTPKKVALSIQKLALELEEAENRDQIAELALDFSDKFLKRVVFFILRKDIAFGWNGFGPGLNLDQIKSIVIPLGDPSIFQTVVQSHGHYLGPVASTSVNNHFLKALGGESPRNVLLLPLTIGNITFGFIYGDNQTEVVDPDGINELQVMVSRVSISFERLIIAERQKALRQHASIL